MGGIKGVEDPLREISVHFVRVAALLAGTWALKKLISKSGRKEGKLTISHHVSSSPNKPGLGIRHT
jgi:hypothetical protein